MADHFFYGVALPFYILVWVACMVLSVCAIGIAVEVFEKHIAQKPIRKGGE